MESGRERGSEAARQIELGLIAADFYFFADIARSPHLETVRAIALLALMPFFATAVVEADAYFERTGLTLPHALSLYEDLLAAARMRVKGLDDNRRTIEDVLDRLRLHALANRKRFHELHMHGQPDLGIYFMSDRVILTTDAALPNTGAADRIVDATDLTMGNLGPFMFEMAKSMGGFSANVLRTLGFDPLREADAPISTVPAIW